LLSEAGLPGQGRVWMAMRCSSGPIMLLMDPLGPQTIPGMAR
jgi:hypothetical protein